MEAIIKNFRMARHHQTDNQAVIIVKGVNNKEEASKLIGKIIVWKTSSGKEIKGKISAAHGSKGAVRAIFERGLPGQAVGTKINIQ